ncbi:MAG TPA: rRNA maturation RNase YbeY [Candidatus Dormibacteraeota bacterium]|nr:rRNA maturation RNase YbeY [Candidatus Dormibacteraeota bacterium]
MIRRALETAARIEAVPEGLAVGVLVCDDPTIRGYNRRFAGEDHATDVLAFASGDDGELGDIILSLDHLRRQAAEAGHSAEVEAATLAVHGFLHLRGYDHAKRRDREVMFARTDEIVTAAGLAGAGVSANRSGR